MTEVNNWLQQNKIKQWESDDDWILFENISNKFVCTARHKKANIIVRPLSPLPHPPAPRRNVVYCNAANKSCEQHWGGRVDNLRPNIYDLHPNKCAPYCRSSKIQLPLNLQICLVFLFSKLRLPPCVTCIWVFIVWLQSSTRISILKPDHWFHLWTICHVRAVWKITNSFPIEVVIYFFYLFICLLIIYLLFIWRGKQTGNIIFLRQAITLSKQRI